MTQTATVHAQQRWEYQELTRKTVTYLVNELNEVGQQGWELVTLMQCKDRKGELAWTAVMKRPFVPHGSMPARKSVAPEAAAGSVRKPARLEPSGVDADFELEKTEPVEEKEVPQQGGENQPLAGAATPEE